VQAPGQVQRGSGEGSEGSGEGLRGFGAEPPSRIEQPIQLPVFRLFLPQESVSPRNQLAKHT